MDIDLSNLTTKRFTIKVGKPCACADLSFIENEEVEDTISFAKEHPVLSLSKDIDNIPKKETGKWYDFNRLYVATAERDKGIGSQLMRQVTQWADENEINIINSLNPSGDLDMEALTQFYKKFGFIEVVTGLMIRYFGKSL